MLKLENKVCLVTGATSGMGKAIAKAFAAEGAHLILSGRNTERGKQLEQQLVKRGTRAVFVAGDIARSSANEELVRVALKKYGRLDLLSLNAGTLGLGAVTELSEKSWHDTLNTNLSSLFYICKYAMPSLIASGNGNIIINASIAAFKSFPNHAAYCASKAGAVALMKQIAIDYAPKVRANAICPGPVDTPLIWESAKAFPDPDMAVKNAAQATLVNRLGQPDDIAKLAVFLASEAASWICGTTINIDGGILNT